MKQCNSTSMLKDIRCQGVPVHEGPHWGYDQRGHLIMWKNKREKSEEWEKIAEMWLPPDSDKYIHPKDMDDKSYITIHVRQEKNKKKRK